MEYNFVSFIIYKRFLKYIKFSLYNSKPLPKSYAEIAHLQMKAALNEKYPKCAQDKELHAAYF